MVTLAGSVPTSGGRGPRSKNCERYRCVKYLQKNPRGFTLIVKHSGGFMRQAFLFFVFLIAVAFPRTEAQPVTRLVPTSPYYQDDFSAAVADDGTWACVGAPGNNGRWRYLRYFRIGASEVIATKLLYLGY